MAREQKFNNSQREVVNTIEDTSKYQTPVSRRLRVTADPLNIYTAPAESQVSRLAEALGTIKPELLNYATERQTEANIRVIEQGKAKGQTGGIPQGELEQYGFDTVKAVNDWTDWNQQTLQEYEQNFDKQSGNVDEFLQQRWEANPFKDKNDTYVKKFTPLAGKTMAKIREAQGQFTAELEASKNDAELTRMFAGDIKDVIGAGLEYGVPQYETRRALLKGMFPGKTNSQLDELAYQAVLNTMQESGDTSLVKIFKQPHSDKTPGLYEIPKWKAKIDSDVAQIISAKVTQRNREEAEMDKALKVVADTKERELLFEIADINTFDDPTVRDEKLRDLTAKAKLLSDSGIPISNTIIKTLISANTGIDKKQESQYQAENYVKLRLSGSSPSTIAQKFLQGVISQSGFDKLMTKYESVARREGSGGKPLSANPFVKDMFKTIQSNAGYSFGSMAKDNEQMKKNADAVSDRLLEYVEDLTADGSMSLKEATEKAKERGVQMLKDAGLNSKSRADADRKLDAVEQKAKDPVSFYKANPSQYLIDVATKTVPAIPEKDLKEIQDKARMEAKNQKLKRHESTK